MGVAIGDSVAVSLPEHVLRLCLGLFILALTWLPRPRTRQVNKIGEPCPPNEGR